MTHPLDGPRLKIARAKSEIDRLREAEKAFRTEAKYRVVRAELNPDTGKYIHRFEIIYFPPLDDWGVWVGEIIHNLRSALDILVYQLARRNHAPANVRDTQFPIFRRRYTRRIGTRTFMGFEGDKGARAAASGSGRKMIDRLCTDHQTRIEGMQPYRRKGKQAAFGRPLVGRWSLLHRLHELNNADKHRLIQVVGAKPGAGPMVAGWGEETETEFRFMHAQILKNGTPIVEASAKMHVDSDILLLIAFAKGCEAVKYNGVCYVLSLIANHVDEIVESFTSDFRKSR